MVKKIVGAAMIDSVDSPQRLLIARRTSPHQFAGMYEFPGGKVETGESCEAALHREIMEELGVEIELGAEIVGPGTYGWPLSDAAEMRVWLAEVTQGEPAPLEDHDELRWVHLSDPELLQLPWIPADLPIVEEILRTLRAGAEPK